MKKKRKECTISRSVNCIMSLYIASNIMLLSLQVLLNQLIVVLQPWLLWICGSLLRMKKKLHDQKHGPISVVLNCFCVPCVRQISSKKGGEPILATRCWRFAIEEPPAPQRIISKMIVFRAPCLFSYQSPINWALQTGYGNTMQKRRRLHKKINRHRSPRSGTTFEPPSFKKVIKLYTFTF